MRLAIILSLTCLVAPACPGPGGIPASPTPANAPAVNRPPAGTPAPANQASGATDRQKLSDGVRDVVAEVLGVAPAEVDVRAPLSKQKAPADELDAVEIVLRVEEKFGVEIPDEEIGGPDAEWQTILSVEKLAQIVAARKSRK